MIKSTLVIIVAGVIAGGAILSAIYLVESRASQVYQSTVDEEFHEEYKQWAEGEIVKFKDYSESLKAQIDELDAENEELRKENERLRTMSINLQDQLFEKYDEQLEMEKEFEKQMEQFQQDLFERQKQLKESLDEFLSQPYIPKKPDRGDLIILYGQTSKTQYQYIISWLKQGPADDLTGLKTLNEKIAFPHNIPVIFYECGESNAYYSSFNKEIVLCYELLESLIIYFDNKYPEWEDESKFNAAKLVMGWIFFHEFGHALIDVYDLPVTGKEEDSADQLATFFTAPVGNQVVLKLVGNWFLDEANSKSQTRFWGVHSLDIQRYYNIFCWMYGYDLNKNDFLVSSGLLPIERAVYCPDEYEQIKQTWNDLLSPIIKS